MPMLRCWDRRTTQPIAPTRAIASYHSLPGAADAVWFYAQPYEAVAAIKDHLAFYASKMDSIELLPD